MNEVKKVDIKEFEDGLIKSVLDSIERHGGKECLSSIIMTGSFGRGEPTYKRDADGRLELKSDIEIALVFPHSSKKTTIEKLIQDVKESFTEELNLMAINEKRIRKAYNFNFSLIVPKYKTIFTYDLFNGSKTIWGENFIESNHIVSDDIDPYEAKRIIANRIGELVYLQNVNKNIDEKDYLRKQWKSKLLLAIGSALLVCKGEYASGYHEQYQKLQDNIDDVSKIVGSDFFEEYEKAFQFLREDGELYEVSDKKLIAYVNCMDCYFRKNQIVRPQINCFSRSVKYMRKYVKTGMKYGVVGFENNILQALILNFCRETDLVVRDAEVWHSVLY